MGRTGPDPRGRRPMAVRLPVAGSAGAGREARSGHGAVALSASTRIARGCGRWWRRSSRGVVGRRLRGTAGLARPGCRARGSVHGRARRGAITQVALRYRWWSARPALVNGAAGLVSRLRGRTGSVTGFTVVGRRIVWRIAPTIVVPPARTSRGSSASSTRSVSLRRRTGPIQTRSARLPFSGSARHDRGGTGR